MIEDTHQNVLSRLSKARLDRLPRLALVSCAVWAFFSVHDPLTDRAASGIVCGIFALLAAAIYFLSNGRLIRRQIVTWAHLTLSLIGICTVGLVTGQAESHAPVFLCVFGVFASHMLGIRASLIWSAITIVVLAVFNSEYFDLNLPVLASHTIRDKTLNCIGVIVVIFFFNWQSQHYFMVLAKELTQTTDSLREKADALRQLAEFDTLTGLFNRHSFHRQAQISLMNAQESKKSMGLLLLDLDGFKEINDTQGHQLGDLVLLEVAKRLREQVAGEHLVARLGGDEFTVIVEGVEEHEEVLAIGEQLVASLCEPYFIDDKRHEIGASIGASLYPAHGKSINGLLAFSDTAMYRAKRAGNKIELYHPDMTEALLRRRELEGQLADALECEEYRLVYQPQVNCRTGKIIGFEALLRWMKDGKWISPGEFIGQLESMQEIYAVGAWVLEEACLQAQEWRSAGYDIQMSVNVSANQFRDPLLVDKVLAALEISKLDPGCLDLEITESVVIDDVQTAAANLFELRSLGASISIDDFGTGYSSLAYLRELPFTRLKIDRAFIKGIPEEDDGTIAQTVVDLSHNLKLKVLAEGVETREQLDFLREHGCDEYQGYFFAKPLGAEECGELLSKEQTGKPEIVQQT